MQIIKLTKGQVAIVDDEDFEELNQYKWYAVKGGNTFYATRNTPRANQTQMQMHREIMDTPKGLQTDHIDGDGLNNCRSNLRIVTSRQNHQNLHTDKGSTFPGVSWHKVVKRWRAQIKVNGKKKHLGYFDIEAEAYEAYLKALEDIGEKCVNDIKREGKVDAA